MVGISVGHCWIENTSRGQRSLSNMVEKRGIDESGSHEPPPPAKKPAISLEALEKAKKALQLQKELKEKLKNLPQVPGWQIC